MASIVKTKETPSKIHLSFTSSSPQSFTMSILSRCLSFGLVKLFCHMLPNNPHISAAILPAFLPGRDHKDSFDSRSWSPYHPLLHFLAAPLRSNRLVLLLYTCQRKLPTNHGSLHPSLCPSPPFQSFTINRSIITRESTIAKTTPTHPQESHVNQQQIPQHPSCTGQLGRIYPRQ